MKKTFAAALLATASLAAPAVADDQASLSHKWTAADLCVVDTLSRAITAGASRITVDGDVLESLKTACEGDTNSKIDMTKGMTTMSMSVK